MSMVVVRYGPVASTPVCGVTSRAPAAIPGRGAARLLVMRLNDCGDPAEMGQHRTEADPVNGPIGTASDKTVQSLATLNQTGRGKSGQGAGDSRLPLLWLNSQSSRKFLFRLLNISGVAATTRWFSGPVRRSYQGQCPEIPLLQIEFSAKAIRRMIRHLAGRRPTRVRVPESGGAKGIRTPDLLNAIQALSQLSYGPGYCASCTIGFCRIKQPGHLGDRSHTAHDFDVCFWEIGGRVTEWINSRQNMSDQQLIRQVRVIGTAIWLSDGLTTAIRWVCIWCRSL